MELQIYIKRFEYRIKTIDSYFAEVLTKPNVIHLDNNIHGLFSIVDNFL